MGPAIWLASGEDVGVARNAFRGHDAVGGGEISGDRIAVMRTHAGRYTLLAFFEAEEEAAAMAYYNEVGGQ
jgi:hypothetical protein